jgi:hypothetical protein
LVLGIFGGRLFLHVITYTCVRKKNATLKKKILNLISFFFLYSNRDSIRELGNYKFNKNSVISVINREDEDQRRKLKYLPPRESDKSRFAKNTNSTIRSMILDQGSSSSTSSVSSSYKSSESKINSTQKTINHTLPKGQTKIPGKL